MSDSIRMRQVLAVAYRPGEDVLGTRHQEVRS